MSTRRCLPPDDPFSRGLRSGHRAGDRDIRRIEQDFAINRIGHASFGGGIGIAGDGSVVITFSQENTGACQCPFLWSTYATVQKPGDAANTIRPPQLIAAGTPVCAGGPNCFGVNTASLTSLPVVPDPLDRGGGLAGVRHP